MVDLPAEFIERMKQKLGAEYGKFIKSYERAPVKGVRVNTLKISSDEFEKISPFQLEGKVPWAEGGYFVSGDGLGRTIAHAAGLYYVQEPSAMSVAPKLEAKPGERILDLCSAPGGKGTQTAQYMRGNGVLVLNEIDFKRAEALASNAERLGVKNALITRQSPENLAPIFENYFDKILVDAPCSGEGMFRKEADAVRDWSVKNVKTCALRQSKILDSADRMLCGGGRLVYSTCTFAPEEDEEQIENFVKTHAGYKLLEMRKLLPHEVRGEGHFYAVLEKQDGERADLPPVKYSADKSALKLFEEFSKENLPVRFGHICKGGNALYSVPDGMPLPAGMLRAGVRLGEVINGRFQPSHSLAMCLKKEEAASIEVDENTALSYLRGLTFDCAPSEKGWRLVTYLGYPLGWCKAVNGVAKNHLPKGLRI